MRIRTNVRVPGFTRIADRIATLKRTAAVRTRTRPRPGKPATERRTGEPRR